MNLQNKRILIAAQYAAPYPGNFIPSLVLLKNELSDRFNARCAFAFPKKVAEREWYNEFSKRHKIYLTGNDSILILENEGEIIINDFKPDLIYSHFEGYDIPLWYAKNKVDDNIHAIWHMHDTLSLHPHPLKALIVWFSLWKHYGKTFFQYLFNRSSARQ